MRATRSVLILDRDDALRDGLRALLASTSIDVVECATGEEALAAIERQLPAVVVAEVAPDLGGHELCRAIRRRYGEEVGVVLTSADRTTAADRTIGLLLGADDYLVKPFDWGELLARVNRLFARCLQAQPDGAGPARATSSEPAGRLTQREREVLQLLAEGQSQDDICATLVIAPKTASAHIQRILVKIGAHSRAQAIAIAYRDGLVRPPAPRG